MSWYEVAKARALEAKEAAEAQAYDLRQVAERRALEVKQAAGKAVEDAQAGAKELQKRAETFQDSFKGALPSFAAPDGQRALEFAEGPLGFALEGDIVTRVDPDGQGARLGVRPGDRLVAVACEPLPEPPGHSEEEDNRLLKRLIGKRIKEEKRPVQLNFETVQDDRAEPEEVADGSGPASTSTPAIEAAEAEALVAVESTANILIEAPIAASEGDEAGPVSDVELAVGADELAPVRTQSVEALATKAEGSEAPRTEPPSSEEQADAAPPIGSRATETPASEIDKARWDMGEMDLHMDEEVASAGQGTPPKPNSEIEEGLAETGEGVAAKQRESDIAIAHREVDGDSAKTKKVLETATETAANLKAEEGDAAEKQRTADEAAVNAKAAEDAADARKKLEEEETAKRILLEEEEAAAKKRELDEAAAQSRAEEAERTRIAEEEAASKRHELHQAAADLKAEEEAAEARRKQEENEAMEKNRRKKEEAAAKQRELNEAAARAKAEDAAEANCRLEEEAAERKWILEVEAAARQKERDLAAAHQKSEVEAAEARQKVEEEEAAERRRLAEAEESAKNAEDEEAVTTGSAAAATLWERRARDAESKIAAHGAEMEVLRERQRAQLEQAKQQEEQREALISQLAKERVEAHMATDGLQQELEMKIQSSDELKARLRDCEELLRVKDDEALRLLRDVEEKAQEGGEAEARLRELEAVLRESEEQAAKRIEKLRQEGDLRKARLGETNTWLKACELELKEAQAQVKERDEQLRALTRETDQLKQTCASEKGRSEDASLQADALRGSFQSLTGQLEKAKAELNLQAEVRDREGEAMRSSSQAADSEAGELRKLLEDTRETLSSELEASRSQAAALSLSLRDTGEEAEAAAARAGSLSEAHGLAEEKVNKLEGNLARTNSALVAAGERDRCAERELVQLRSECREYQSSGDQRDDRFNAVQSLLEARAQDLHAQLAAASSERGVAASRAQVLEEQVSALERRSEALARAAARAQRDDDEARSAAREAAARSAASLEQRLREADDALKDANARYGEAEREAACRLEAVEQRAACKHEGAASRAAEAIRTAEAVAAADARAAAAEAGMAQMRDGVVHELQVETNAAKTAAEGHKQLIHALKHRLVEQEGEAGARCEELQQQLAEARRLLAAAAEAQAKLPFQAHRGGPAPSTAAPTAEDDGEVDVEAEAGAPEASLLEALEDGGGDGCGMASSPSWKLVAEGGVVEALARTGAVADAALEEACSPPEAAGHERVGALLERIRYLERRNRGLQKKVDAQPIIGGSRGTPTLDGRASEALPLWQRLTRRLEQPMGDMTQRLLRSRVLLWLFYAQLFVLYTIAATCLLGSAPSPQEKLTDVELVNGKAAPQWAPNHR